MNYKLVKDNKVIKTYKHLGHAKRGLRALYDNGKVLPDDHVYIYFDSDYFKYKQN